MKADKAPKRNDSAMATPHDPRVALWTKPQREASGTSTKQSSQTCEDSDVPHRAETLKAIHKRRPAIDRTCRESIDGVYVV